MDLKHILRILGVAIIAILVLLAIVLNNYGVVRLSEFVGDIWFLILGAGLTLAFQLIVFPERFLPSKSKGGSKPEADLPSFEKGLIRQSELQKVNADLDAHYKAVIDRMIQLWDYQPKDLGEQIFTKGTTPGHTFGQTGLIVSYSDQIPRNLDEDKMHLKEFREPWDFYSKGRSAYADANNLEEQTKRWVRDYLITPLIEVEPPCRLLDKFTDEIISRRDARNRGLVGRDFEATMMEVHASSSPVVRYPAIDTEVLDAVLGPPETIKWTLQKAQKLAELMNRVLGSEDLADLVKKKRQAWEAVSKNKNDFLTALREKVINPATNSHYQSPELTRGICIDCCHLKAKRDSLRGA